MEKVTLKVNNMVLTGHLPLKKKLSHEQINNLIKRGKMNWNLICEETCPRLHAIVEKDELKKNGKKKTASITLWFPNIINIVGVTSRREAEGYLYGVISDLKKIVGRSIYG